MTRNTEELLMKPNDTSTDKNNQSLAARIPNGIVLIDDDHAYQQLFKASAAHLGIKASTFSSLSEMTSFALLSRFDVAFFDYRLQSFTGSEIAEYVDVFFPDLPVFLVSGNVGAIDRSKIPNSVRDVFSKDSSPEKLIRLALEAIERERQYQRLWEWAFPDVQQNKLSNSAGSKLPPPGNFLAGVIS
jgi:DNA-binding NtrC family response regulator